MDDILINKQTTQLFHMDNDVCGDSCCDKCSNGSPIDDQLSQLEEFGGSSGTWVFCQRCGMAYVVDGCGVPAESADCLGGCGGRVGAQSFPATYGKIH